jgi:hypothetical protein
MSEAVAQSAAPRAASRSSAFIVSPWYDLTFFLASPVLALVLGGLISGSVVANRPLMLGGHYSSTLVSCFIGTFIMSHLFLVFFRSHLNPTIFKSHPLRFTVVPLTLFMAMNYSLWFAVAVGVVATWWDVYHSSLQTFGIGRIYDMKRGNDALVGRQLDRWLNLYIYAGPILAGATLMDHVEDFDSFRDVGSVFFAAIPALVESNSSYLTWGVVGTGVPFLMYYIYSYWRYSQQGYSVSYQKVALLVTTGIVSIYTWGFNTFGEAFFIMNFFHAWQYFAIVWWSEKKNMTHRFRLDNFSWGPAVMFSIFIGIAVAYGFWAETFDTQSAIMFNLVIVVAIMHFWYDGFIWSVRKKQV